MKLGIERDYDGWRKWATDYIRERDVRGLSNKCGRQN